MPISKVGGREGVVTTAHRRYAAQAINRCRYRRMMPFDATAIRPTAARETRQAITPQPYQ